MQDDDMAFRSQFNLRWSAELELPRVNMGSESAVMRYLPLLVRSQPQSSSPPRNPRVRMIPRDD